MKYYLQYIRGDEQPVYLMDIDLNFNRSKRLRLRDNLVTIRVLLRRSLQVYNGSEISEYTILS